MTRPIEPRYTHLVLAIPHAHAEPSFADWRQDPEAAAYADRWTDWLTDELFVVDDPRVIPVIGRLSRLDCDLERLEGEPDRIGKFRNHLADPRRFQITARQRNAALAEWYAYRAEVMKAVASGERPLIIDCHSFPSELAPDVDICLGVNEDLSRPPEDVLGRVWDVFAQAGYRVALNHPYSNALAPVGFEGNSLMIEVSKAVYLEGGGCQASAGLADLRTVLKQLYGNILACPCGNNEIMI